jgi:hypothetical protein
MRERTILLFSTILFLTLFPWIQHGLWRPDEPQVAGVCAEMAYQKDFVVPRLNGQPFLEKPPLYYALGAISGAIFGKNDEPFLPPCLLLIRLPRPLHHVPYGLHEERHHERTLGSRCPREFVGFFRLARWIQVDMALVFSVTLSMYAYMRLSEKSRRRYAMLMGLGVGLSFMANNLMRFTGAPEGQRWDIYTAPFSTLEAFLQTPCPGLLHLFQLPSLRKPKDDPYSPWFIGPCLLPSIASVKRGLWLASFWDFYPSQISISY